MAQSSTMTVRLDEATLERLEKLAKATARSKAYLAQEAIQAYLDLQEWQVAAVAEGAHDADEGHLVDEDVVDEWLASWGSTKEKRPPR